MSRCFFYRAGVDILLACSGCDQLRWGVSSLDEGICWVVNCSQDNLDCTLKNSFDKRGQQWMSWLQNVHGKGNSVKSEACAKMCSFSKVHILHELFEYSSQARASEMLATTTKSSRTSWRLFLTGMVCSPLCGYQFTVNLHTFVGAEICELTPRSSLLYIMGSKFKICKGEGFNCIPL